MMGIKVDEPAFIFGDNKSGLFNTTNSGSTLKKKSNVIAYHFVREGVARDEWRTSYVCSDDNVADMLTKPLSGPKRVKFVQIILQHIYPVKEGWDNIRRRGVSHSCCPQEREPLPLTSV